MANITSPVRDKALKLLGYGGSVVSVAAACGVTESDISQYLSDPEFAAAVAELRYEAQSKHNARDEKLDSLEDSLIEKLETLKDLMIRPMEVLKALQIVNAAKRRGASSPEVLATQQQVVSLTIPVFVTQRFSTNIHNQVVVAGNQELVTIPSNDLINTVKQKIKSGIQHGARQVTTTFEGEASPAE